MTHRHLFEAELVRSWPTESWQELGVLLAVSGGADSVALLRAMARLKTEGCGTLTVAHFNHQLQEESDQHQQFVEALAAELGLPCEIGHPQQALGGTGGDGLEAAARRVRYAFLQATAERLGARYVVTAHTTDDQVETILHRVIRGTGLTGLSGIPRVRPLGSAVTLIRPLLGQSRHQVLAYLSDLKQSYCEDATNAEVHFTRNRIRHELLPQIASDFNPGIGDALLRLSQIAGEAQAIVQPLVEEMIEQAVATDITDSNQKTVVIDSRPIHDQPPYLLRELFKQVWRDQSWPEQSMGFAQWGLLTDLLLSLDAGGCENLPGGIRAQKSGAKLRLGA